MSIKLVAEYHLSPDALNRELLKNAPTRQGFGEGLRDVATENASVVGLCADLTESTYMHLFARSFPERFVQVGVAEQNLVTVASGMAHMGKIPFCSSYAAFSPGRNWEQIRTTICYNNQPVKIVGSHTGLTVGPDGATHQMLEDIALMRALPNMVVVVPADSQQANAATRAIALDPRPGYLRVSREKSPIFTTADTPFEIGRAQVLAEGSDVTLVACGSLVYEALSAAQMLAGEISVEVINMHTIVPFDAETLIASARKTGLVISLEEHQISGGLGGAVAEALGERLPTELHRIGMPNEFGQSGTAAELWKNYGLDAESVAERIRKVVKHGDS